MQGLKGALSELKNVVKEKKDKVSQDMLESRKSVKVGSLPMTKKVGGAKKETTSAIRRIKLGHRRAPVAKASDSEGSCP